MFISADMQHIPNQVVIQDHCLKQVRQRFIAGDGPIISFHHGAVPVSGIILRVRATAVKVVRVD